MRSLPLSNKILSFFLVLGIFISVLNVWSMLSPHFFVLFSEATGFGALANATVTLEILRTNSIAVAGAISFGTGTVYTNNSAQPIVLNSTGNCPSANVSFSTNACIARSSTNPADNATNKITIANDGNINVTVTVDINTTQSSLGLGTGGDVAFWLGQEEVASATKPACISENGTTYGGSDTTTQGFFPNRTGYRHASQFGTNGIPVSLFSVSGTSNAAGRSLIVICSKLQPDDSFDLINMTIYLNISKDAGGGGKAFLLNFSALDRFTTES